VEHFLGPKPCFGQGPTEGIIPTVDLPILEAARFTGAPIVFLGLKEPQANEYSPTIPPEELAKALVGTPFFSIDVSDVSQTELDRLVQTSLAGADGFDLSFAEARAAMRGMSEFDAGVFAEARSMVDWNSRNKVWGGRHRFVVFHRSSTSLLSSVLPVAHSCILFGEDGSCHAQASYHPLITLAGGLVPRSPSLTLSLWAYSSLTLPLARKGLHNITHPRTDAVVIVAVLNESRDKILLGRNVGCSFCVDQRVFLIFWESEKVPREVLLHPGRVHRTRRIV
jgi:NAD+ diphosphatase